MKHPLFVTNDDFRCVEVHKFLQPIVTVDDTTIKVVQVAGRKVARIKQNERAQVWWNDWNTFQNHPLRTIFAIAKSFHNLQPLGQIFQLLLAGSLGKLLTKLLGDRCQIES